MIQKLLLSLALDPTITKLIILLSSGMIAGTILIRVLLRNAFVRILPGILLLFFSVFKFMSVLPRFLEKSSLEPLTEVMIGLILAGINICTACIIGLLIPKKKVRKRTRKVVKNENHGNRISQ